jgi:ACS family hexuronate transporter-like MFS transporter
MVNSFFLGAYGFGLLFMGRIIDRVGVKRGYAVVLFLWSIAAFSHTFVTTVGGFIAARMFLGLSEAGNFPAAIKAIAQWFPSTERAFATALFNSGANVGAVLAPFLVAALLRADFTWHAPFIIAGCAGMVWVVIWWFSYAHPEQSKAVSPAELAWIRRDPISRQETAPAVAWVDLFRHRQTWSYIVAKVLTDPVWYFILFWLPDYFKKTRGLDIKASWPHLMTVYLIITVLSLFGGYLPGLLVRLGWSLTRARKTAMFAYAALIVPILLVSVVGDWTAVILIGIVGAAHQSWSANLYTTVSDMFPKNSIGSVVGIGSMAGSVSSMAFIYFCGHILDIYGPDHAHDGYFLLFCFSAFAYLVAFGLQHLLAPKFAPITMRD